MNTLPEATDIKEFARKVKAMRDAQQKFIRNCQLRKYHEGIVDLLLQDILQEVKS